ncbi:transposase [Nocardia sp. NPDC059239]|uniref:transposase n=1 Tax=Nocardia sp. NPDC059239 TaxID=3346785 RepID=UPI0036B9261C
MMCGRGRQVVETSCPRRVVGSRRDLATEVQPAPAGRRHRPDRRTGVFTAVVFVFTSGCAWRLLPSSFGVTVPTAHRRFTVWTEGRPVAASTPRRARRAGQPRLDRLVADGDRRGVGAGQKGDL